MRSRDHTRLSVARLCAWALTAAACSGCAVSDGPAGKLLSSPSAAGRAAVEPRPSPGVSEQNTDARSGLGLTPAELWASWNALRGEGYELDGLDRFLDQSQKKVRCAPESLVTYRGAAIRYQVPVTINPAFQERLGRFEDVVAEVSREVYGRPPRRIQHYGAYSCRTSRNRSRRLSEHALGNALDVVGFDFGPATKAEPLAAELPRRLSQSFQVRVAKHWSPDGAPERDSVARAHARFLHLLTERLIARRDIFRGFVGPSDPSHTDHFHFDVAPWRYVRL